MERSFTSPDSPNVLLWSMVGDVTVVDIRRLFAEQLAFCQGKSFIYVIVDLTRMNEIDGEARRASARAPTMDGKPMPIKAIAIVGGSFRLRLLGKMINKAATVLNRVDAIPMEFFGTIPEARTWIKTRDQAEQSK